MPSRIEVRFFSKLFSIEIFRTKYTAKAFKVNNKKELPQCSKFPALSLWFSIIHEKQMNSSITLIKNRPAQRNTAAEPEIEFFTDYSVMFARGNRNFVKQISVWNIIVPLFLFEKRNCILHNVKILHPSAIWSGDFKIKLLNRSINLILFILFSILEGCLILRPATNFVRFPGHSTSEICVQNWKGGWNPSDRGPGRRVIIFRGRSVRFNRA